MVSSDKPFCFYRNGRILNLSVMKLRKLSLFPWLVVAVVWFSDGYLYTFSSQKFPLNKLKYLFLENGLIGQLF